MAVEDFSALDERRDFLTSQIEDLASSRAALQRVVRAIDRKMKEAFLTKE